MSEYALMDSFLKGTPQIGYKVLGIPKVDRKIFSHTYKGIVDVLDNVVVGSPLYRYMSAYHGAADNVMGDHLLREMIYHTFLCTAVQSVGLETATLQDTYENVVTNFAVRAMTIELVTNWHKDKSKMPDSPDFMPGGGPVRGEFIGANVQLLERANAIRGSHIRSIHSPAPAAIENPALVRHNELRSKSLMSVGPDGIKGQMNEASTVSVPDYIQEQLDAAEDAAEEQAERLARGRKHRATMLSNATGTAVLPSTLKSDSEGLRFKPTGAEEVINREVDPIDVKVDIAELDQPVTQAPPAPATTPARKPIAVKRTRITKKVEVKDMYATDWRNGQVAPQQPAQVMHAPVCQPTGYAVPQQQIAPAASAVPPPPVVGQPQQAPAPQVPEEFRVTTITNHTTGQPILTASGGHMEIYASVIRADLPHAPVTQMACDTMGNQIQAPMFDEHGPVLQRFFNGAWNQWDWWSEVVSVYERHEQWHSAQPRNQPQQVHSGGGIDPNATTVFSAAAMDVNHLSGVRTDDTGSSFDDYDKFLVEQAAACAAAAQQQAAYTEVGQGYPNDYDGLDFSGGAGGGWIQAPTAEQPQPVTAPQPAPVEQPVPAPQPSNAQQLQPHVEATPQSSGHCSDYSLWMVKGAVALNFIDRDGTPVKLVRDCDALRKQSGFSFLHNLYLVDNNTQYTMWGVYNGRIHEYIVSRDKVNRELHQPSTAGQPRALEWGEGRTPHLVEDFSTLNNNPIPRPSVDVTRNEISEESNMSQLKAAAQEVVDRVAKSSSTNVQVSHITEVSHMICPCATDDVKDAINAINDDTSGDANERLNGVMNLLNVAKESSPVLHMTLNNAMTKWVRDALQFRLGGEQLMLTDFHAEWAEYATHPQADATVVATLINALANEYDHIMGLCVDDEGAIYRSRDVYVCATPNMNTTDNLRVGLIQPQMSLYADVDGIFRNKEIEQDEVAHIMMVNVPGGSVLQISKDLTPGRISNYCVTELNVL